VPKLPVLKPQEVVSRLEALGFVVPVSPAQRRRLLRRFDS
jgi:predicted RNA binding protein YcfA (HicA-like mRNA interferase family)